MTTVAQTADRRGFRQILVGIRQSNSAKKKNIMSYIHTDVYYTEDRKTRFTATPKGHTLPIKTLSMHIKVIISSLHKQTEIKYQGIASHNKLLSMNQFSTFQSLTFLLYLDEDGLKSTIHNESY
jgi:hypothetical protein